MFSLRSPANSGRISKSQEPPEYDHWFYFKIVLDVKKKLCRIKLLKNGGTSQCSVEPVEKPRVVHFWPSVTELRERGVA